MAQEALVYPSVQDDPNEYAFDLAELAEIQQHLAKYPSAKSAVMPALWIAQEKWGWLPQKAIKLVADTLSLPYAQVYGVATFYTMYLKENRGQHLIEICTCFTCGVCGGEELLNALKTKHNANEQGTSADGRFFFRVAECLGACDSAPVAQINNRRLVMNASEGKMEQVLDALLRGEEVPFESVPMVNPAL